MQTEPDPYFEAWVRFFRVVIRLRRRWLPRTAPRPAPRPAPHAAPIRRG